MTHPHPLLEPLQPGTQHAALQLTGRELTPCALSLPACHANIARLERGSFCCANKAALDVFGIKGRALVPAKGDARAAPGAIELVVPPSVSPACASVHFGNKRDCWMSDVFDCIDSV